MVACRNPAALGELALRQLLQLAQDSHRFSRRDFDTLREPSSMCLRQLWRVKPVALIKPCSVCMTPSYTELHCLSNFSFLRGASHPEELVERALALEYSGLALTDECSFAGSVRAHLALTEAREQDEPARAFRLIHGTEIRLTEGDDPKRRRPAPSSCCWPARAPATAT